MYYLDLDGVVLPRVRLGGTGEHLVRLRGWSLGVPAPGERINSPAVLAGLELLAMFRKVDEDLDWEERLWEELAVLDVSNFEGRISNADAHLVVYTTNDTEILWGAQVGRSRVLYEAPYKEKLRRLYQHKKGEGSLGAYERIDLRPIRKEKADPLRTSS